MVRTSKTVHTTQFTYISKGCRTKFTKHMSQVLMSRDWCSVRETLVKTDSTCTACTNEHTIMKHVGVRRKVYLPKALHKETCMCL
jgi:hypothetical protein